MFALYELENQNIFDQKANSKTCFLLLTLCQKQLSIQVDAFKISNSTQKHSGWILQIFFNLNKKTD